jgi:hypothetical protein
MMAIEAIQTFELFEDRKTKVYFRAPTVADYRAFVGMSSRLEEMVTTQYLNQIQIADRYPNKEVLDSALWSCEDRRTALYWIFMNTRDNTIIEQAYLCQHCKKQHARQLDLVDLGAYFIQTKHSMREKLVVANVKDGFIQPLRGNAMEHLEQLRNLRDDHKEDSPEWCLAHTDLRIYELSWALVFNDDDKTLSLDEQATARYNYLLTLEADSKFKQVAAQVRHALSAMRHGLMSEYLDGETRLVTPPHKCPNSEEQEGSEIKETILLLPFLYHYFLPTL